MSAEFTKIIIPSRPQVDTTIAILLLKVYGHATFPGIENATYEVASQLPAGETEDSMEAKGVLALDVGGGKFDHHNKGQTTASTLIAKHLQIDSDPAIEKLLALAARDDFFGKGTISADPLDRAFGFPGLLASANRTYPNDPILVIDLFLPIIQGHLAEEIRRTKELPEELANKTAAGQVTNLEVKSKDKKLKVILIESDNVSMPGFLRSRLGGANDVVVQIRSTGHVNILTRPAKRIDLRFLAAAIRKHELISSGSDKSFPENILTKAGRFDDVPGWYYDTATNSIQNGGSNPSGVPCTKISKTAWSEILTKGLAGSL